MKREARTTKGYFPGIIERSWKPEPQRGTFPAAGKAGKATLAFFRHVTALKSQQRGAKFLRLRHPPRVMPPRERVLPRRPMT